MKLLINEIIYFKNNLTLIIIFLRVFINKKYFKNQILPSFF